MSGFDWQARLELLDRGMGMRTPATAEALVAMRTALSAADRLAEAVVREDERHPGGQGFDRLRVLAEGYRATGR